MSPIPESEPRTYSLEVSDYLVERVADWTRIGDLGADWIKATPHDDGTVEVLLAVGDEPPAA